MNKKFTRNDDDNEDGEDFPNPKKVQYYKRAIPSFEMIVNLNDSIRDPGHYFDLVEEMESLTENDIVDLKVNSQKGVGRHMHGQEAEEATYMSCFQTFNRELPE